MTPDNHWLPTPSLPIRASQVDLPHLHIESSCFEWVIAGKDIHLGFCLKKIGSIILRVTARRYFGVEDTRLTLRPTCHGENYAGHPATLTSASRQIRVGIVHVHRIMREPVEFTGLTTDIVVLFNSNP